MSNIIRTGLVALIVLTGASAAMAAPARDSGFVDQSKPFGGYDPNSQQGARAWLDYQSQHGH